MVGDLFTRRVALRLTVAASATLLNATFLNRLAIAADAEDDEALMKRFEFLSQNGNVNCSGEFEASIATMPPDARLQGSCCAPMEGAHYLTQIKGIRKYADISEIPPDPYDIPAELAQRLIYSDAIQLTRSEQVTYDYAMTNSDEGGPCCCKCWRWRTYGGLGKLLIRGRAFTGEQLTKVWDLSNGCGGQG